MAMALRLVASLLVCVVALREVMSQQTGCNYPPCNTVPMSVTYFYPNWDDCDTYWECKEQNATLKRCSAGQVFNFLDFTCADRPTAETFLTNTVFFCDLILRGSAALAS